MSNVIPFRIPAPGTRSLDVSLLATEAFARAVKEIRETANSQWGATDLEVARGLAIAASEMSKELCDAFYRCDDDGGVA